MRGNPGLEFIVLDFGTKKAAANEGSVSPVVNEGSVSPVGSAEGKRPE